MTDLPALQMQIFFIKKEHYYMAVMCGCKLTMLKGEGRKRDFLSFAVKGSASHFPILWLFSNSCGFELLFSLIIRLIS